MSVRIGGSEGETSVCFVAGPSLYFVKWGGSAVCQDNITTAHMQQQLRISGVSAAMDQCRRGRPGPSTSSPNCPHKTSCGRKSSLAVHHLRHTGADFTVSWNWPCSLTLPPGPRQLGAGFWRKAADCIVLATVPPYPGGGLSQQSLGPVIILWAGIKIMVRLWMGMGIIDYNEYMSSASSVLVSVSTCSSDCSRLLQYLVRDVRDAAKWPQQSHHHNVSPPPAAACPLHGPLAKWDKTTTG